MPFYAVGMAGSKYGALEVKAAFVRAADKNIALGKANLMAQSTFPPRKGYNAHYVTANELPPPKFGHFVWAVAFLASQQPENPTLSILSVPTWTSDTDMVEADILGAANLHARTTHPTAQAFQFSIKRLGWLDYHLISTP